MAKLGQKRLVWLSGSPWGGRRRDIGNTVVEQGGRGSRRGYYRRCAGRATVRPPSESRTQRRKVSMTISGVLCLVGLFSLLFLCFPIDHEKAVKEQEDKKSEK